MQYLKIFLLLIGIIALPTCLPDGTDMEKIKFDLDQIDKDGLIGPADGKRTLAYEFCIPAEASAREEVKAIDSAIQVFEGSSGRIGCSDQQWLCMGETRFDYRQVLQQLAGLDYVEKIDQAFFE